jgi:hypothetical protein
VLELVHGDLCGKISPPTPAGNQFFLLMVDDRSRYMSVVLLPSKDRAAEAIREFRLRAEAETGEKLGTLRTDRGGEFNATSDAEYFLEQGVQRQLTEPYSPQHNGVVEHRNSIVVGSARSMLKARRLPNWFLGEAIQTIVYVLNRSPTKSVDGATLFELWFGKKLSVHHLRTFGWIGYVKNTRPHLTKLEDRGTRMVFVGYERGTKAFRMYDPVSKRVHIRKGVVFHESSQWDWSSENNSDSAESVNFAIEYLVMSSRIGPNIPAEIELEVGEADEPEGAGSPPGWHVEADQGVGAFDQEV